MKYKLPFLVWSVFASQSYADYKDDIAYTLLQAELGVTIPNAQNIHVTQVEAAVDGAWMPDTGISGFVGKTIVDKTGGSPGFSSHATGVGNSFFGNPGSIAAGIQNIDVYLADDWLLDGFVKTAQSSAPLVSASRLANHSWVGEMDTVENSVRVLKRVDWLVEQDEFLQITAVNNGATNRSLLSNAYNAIAVGRTDGVHAQGSLALDSDYKAGRVRPDVVAPIGSTSGATPVVSAAAALLIDQAHIAAQGPTSEISNGSEIYNGERSEVVKAVIMAGADRVTNNTSSPHQIDGYRSDSVHQSANGLDTRYGAGQINVYNNYLIMEAGEQDSQEDGGLALVDQMGYDYDASFGDTQRMANYQFDTTQFDGLQLTATLAWNIDIQDDRKPGFNASAILHDLNLFLFDITDGVGNELLIADSRSDIDNTENIWYALQKGRDYQLQVTAEGDPFSWDYGLAWKVSAVPVPAAIWLFLSGVIGLSAFRKRGHAHHQY